MWSLASSLVDARISQSSSPQRFQGCVHKLGEGSRCQRVPERKPVELQTGDTFCDGEGWEHENTHLSDRLTSSIHLPPGFDDMGAAWRSRMKSARSLGREGTKWRPYSPVPEAKWQSSAAGPVSLTFFVV